VDAEESGIFAGSHLPCLLVAHALAVEVRAPSPTSARFMRLKRNRQHDIWVYIWQGFDTLSCIRHPQAAQAMENCLLCAAYRALISAFMVIPEGVEHKFRFHTKSQRFYIKQFLQ